LENKGEYINKTEDGLLDIINQKSWVSPRNDLGFKNYNGIEYSVELTTALYAHTISQTLYLLGDKLSPHIRKLAVESVYKRCFEPVLYKINTQNNHPESKFLVMTNNYNHVCLSGVVGAALTLIDDKRERAVFACIGEYYSQNGLAGFGDDGYCSEGVGYFNYGFGNFVVLGESLRRATGGKINLFDNPKVRKIAAYPVKLETINNVYPAIADSQIGASPNPNIMFYVNKIYQMGIPEYEAVDWEGKTNDIVTNIMMAFPDAVSAIGNESSRSGNEDKLRSFFEQSAVLVVRPSTGESSLGAAIKGGNNAENHNHNDVGSYTVVSGDENIAGDQGSIPYTKDIFDPKYRYTYKTVGSYGHPVPLVAGKQQTPGAQAKATVLNRRFSDEEDVFTLDLRPAYDVPSLTKLERTMIYSRKGAGKVSFEDNFAFSQPENFETVVVTRADCKKISDDRILLEGKTQKIEVLMTSPGNKLSIREEKISEGGTPYTRIGIYIDKPLKEGKIILTYIPVRN
ncbi:MAG: heparinase II/III family protein, partial [Tannerella sp.]|nr:heparinase II/III family protein [Tannerella sp.]